MFGYDDVCCHVLLDAWKQMAGGAVVLLARVSGTVRPNCQLLTLCASHIAMGFDMGAVPVQAAQRAARLWSVLAGEVVQLLCYAVLRCVVVPGLVVAPTPVEHTPVAGSPPRAPSRHTRT